MPRPPPLCPSPRCSGGSERRGLPLHVGTGAVLSYRCSRMTVHLINPSHVSFGDRRHHASLALRPGLRDAADLRHARPHRRNARAARSRTIIQAGDVVGIGIHTGNALRGYEIGTAARAAGRLRRVRRHSRDALSGRGPRSRRRPRGRDRRRRAGLAAGAPRLRGGHAERLLRRRPHRGRRRSCRAAGICCRRGATCGRRCRRCAAVRSTAPSARSGAPTASVRGSDTSTACSTRSWSCGAGASGSSRSPMTTSIR